MEIHVTRVANTDTQSNRSMACFTEKPYKLNKVSDDQYANCNK